jgi:hypothetical protein
VFTVRNLVAGLIAGLLVASAQAGGECCDKAKAANGWCGDCKVGFISGVEMKSRMLYDTLAGAPAPADIKCEGCKKAAASNGSCDACGVAFANKRMYKSVFGHAIAMGSYADPKSVKCEGCKKALTGSGGWCDECKAGAVGGYVYKDRKSYDAAVKAREVVVAAAATKCEGCATAMASNGPCKVCNITYADGKKLEAKKAEPKKP